MSLDVKIEQQLRICLRICNARLSTMTWREYHESTKHSVESLRRARRVLDWANMPDPFRHYEGVPVLDLPADPPSPECQLSTCFKVLLAPRLRMTVHLFSRNQLLFRCD